MPELPEVETMRRGVREVVGRRIRRVERMRCALKPILIRPGMRTFRRRAEGTVICEVGRVGKRVVLALEGGQRIVFEPRMTGLVLLAEPPNREHLRLRMELEDGPPHELLYWDRRGLGSVQMFSPEEFDHRFLNGELGPDALAMTADSLRERLGRSRRAIKVALLDQRAVAGIGNLYASEMLHVCGLHPEFPCDRMKAADWEGLAAAMAEVLEEAIRYEGSTLNDGTYRNALNQEGGYQNLHRVYNKADQPCGRCGGGPIARIVQAQRSTFYCPECQPRRRWRRRSRPR